MHARERVTRALRGEPVDRPPLAYLFLGGAHHVLQRTGMRMGAAYRDAGRIAETQLAAAELFGHDTVMAPWGCLTVEAEAFGAELTWHDDFYPQITSHPLADTTDLSVLADPDPSTTGRMPLVHEALRRLRERAGDDLFVVAMVVSPFLVAAELRGMVELLTDFVEDPPFVEALMDRVTEGTARYVRALAGSGACDGVLFENAGMCAELMGPHHAERFVLPYERRLLAAARAEAPGVALIEHNCAQTPYLEHVLTLDVDAVSIAHGDLRAIRDHRVAWIGNVDNTRVMLESTPEDVEREARACIDSARGGAFVLSTSCEIPFKAPLENILALGRAVRAG